MREELLEILENNKQVARLITKDSLVFDAVMIDNLIYRDSINADQLAIAQAVTKGYKKGDFETIYIATKSLKYININVLEEFFFPDDEITLITKSFEKKILVKELKSHYEVLRWRVDL